MKRLVILASIAYAAFAGPPTYTEHIAPIVFNPEQHCFVPSGSVVKWASSHSTRWVR